MSRARAALDTCTLLWTELFLPQNSYVEALTPSVTVFGDSALKE